MGPVGYDPEMPLVGQALPLLVPSVSFAEDIPAIVPFFEVAILAPFRENVHVFKRPHRNCHRRMRDRWRADDIVLTARSCSECAESSYHGSGLRLKQTGKAPRGRRSLKQACHAWTTPAGNAHVIAGCGTDDLPTECE